ncbi:MAG: hydantoinase B/oxoprolinase family protein [Halobacteriales archaeon]|nr:hydantoinase B/oxoprolinase family protein [Halobacteriales archaeon]
MSEIDDITLGVYRDKLVSICDQMTNTLARTSFSPILREAFDLSVGITDRQGRLVAEATNSLPNFTRFLSQASKNMLDEFGVDELNEGDVLASNDPWSETTHQYDIAIIRPVFYDDEFVGFTTGMGHLSDIGGKPYSAEAQSTFEEGLVIPPTKLVRGGDLNDDIVDVIRANVRVPNEVIGDIKSFLSATYTGHEEIVRFLDQYDIDLQAVSDRIIDQSTANMERALDELPDGEYAEAITVDGVHQDIRIACTITIDGERLSVDYAGTDGEVDTAINVPKLYTDSYTQYAIKCVTTPQTRETDGDFQPITITAPEGSILNPSYPAAIAGRALIGHHCAIITNRVLAQVAPGMTMADPGMTMTSQLNFETPDGEQQSEMIFNAGGSGATARKDGAPTLSLPTNTASISIEELESKTGRLRFLKKALRQDSGGPGKTRGGLGQEIKLRNLGPTALGINFLGRKGDFPAKGIQGGHDGTCQSVQLGSEQVPVKSDQRLAPDQVVTYREAGGGGFGDPADRPTDRIQYDLENGYISPEHAREAYGFEPEETQSDQ